MVDLLNLIYTTGVILKKWLKSTFVTIPIKYKVKEVSEHGTGTHESHFKFIPKTIFKNLEEDMNDT